MNPDISARLQDAQAALAGTEAEYAEQALAAAMSDDPNTLAAIEAKVAAARLRVETLGLAEAEVQRLERVRLAGARSDAEKARIRAINQHVGAVVKAAGDFAHFTERQIDSYRVMIKAGRSLEAALKPDEARNWFGGSRPIEATLNRYVELEFARQGNPRSDQLRTLARFPLAPRQFGSFGGLLLPGQALHQASPINDLLKAKYGNMAAVLSGEKPMPPVEPIPPEPSPEAEAAEIVAGPEAEDKIYGTPISELREIHAPAPEFFEGGVEVATDEQIEFAAAVALVSTVDDAVPPSPRELIDAVNLLASRQPK